MPAHSGRTARSEPPADGARVLVLAVCGKSLPWPFSTNTNPKKAKVFRGSLPPHPAADHFIHGLLAFLRRQLEVGCIGAFSRHGELQRGLPVVLRRNRLWRDHLLRLGVECF